MLFRDVFISVLVEPSHILTNIPSLLYVNFCQIVPYKRVHISFYHYFHPLFFHSQGFFLSLLKESY